MSTLAAMPARGRLVAALQLALGALLLVAIWVLLPARYWLVDVVGTLVAVCALAAGVGMLRARGWAIELARAVAWLELVVGTLTVSALALSVAQLAGAYGPVGGGGALLLGTVALLVLPYLVVLPVLQLSWLRDRP